MSVDATGRWGQVRPPSYDLMYADVRSYDVSVGDVDRAVSTVHLIVIIVVVVVVAAVVDQ